VLLLHGTTRQRAESIVKNGPDARYREPNGTTADGFSTAPAAGPFDFGSPEDYARGKAANFPNEGGPAIVALDLPDELADRIVGDFGKLVRGRAFHAGTEVRFDPGGGLEELLAVWPQLTKTISLLDSTP
jgi:hypothetical protein